MTWLMYELFLFGVEFELFYSVLFWYINCVINKLYISLNYRLFLFPCVYALQLQNMLQSAAFFKCL